MISITQAKDIALANNKGYEVLNAIEYNDSFGFSLAPIGAELFANSNVYVVPKTHGKPKWVYAFSKKLNNKKIIRIYDSDEL